MFEMLGGGAEQQERPPLALRVGGHVIQSLAKGPGAAEVMMLVKKLIKA